MVIQHKCVFQARWNLLLLLSVLSVSTPLTRSRNINLITGVFHKEFSVLQRATELYYETLTQHSRKHSWHLYRCSWESVTPTLSVLQRNITLKMLQTTTEKMERKKSRVKTFIFEHLKLAS